MAEVWEGYDVVLSRPVAIKVLQAHLAGDGVFLERFRREAVTAARLSHAGIVATFDTGLDHGTAYIVMELVRGRNLRQYMSDTGPLPVWQAVAVARQVADALAYAHQAGLVHRDVKPANILLLEDEWGGTRVKVTDFGIAKAGEPTGADLTRTGIVLGTPKYLSPEQIKGQDPDPRADLYSLGVVLFEMLAGAPPYVGETDLATALAHLNERVPKVSSRIAGIPPALDRLVSDLLAKDPDKRVASAIVVRQRLDALGPLSGGPSRSHGGTLGAMVARRAGLTRTPAAPGAGSPAMGVPAAGQAPPGAAGPGSAGPGSAGPGSAVPGFPPAGSGAPPAAAATNPSRPSTPTGFPDSLDPVVNPTVPPSREVPATRVAPSAAPAGPPIPAPVSKTSVPSGAVGPAGAPIPVGVAPPGAQASVAGAPPAGGEAGVASPSADPRTAQSGAAVSGPLAAVGVASSSTSAVAPGAPAVTRVNGAATDATVATPVPGAAQARRPAGYPLPTAQPGDPKSTTPGRPAAPAKAGPPSRRFRRSERITGGVVVTVVAVGALVAAVLFMGQRSHRNSQGGPRTPAASGGSRVLGVAVFMSNGRPPDDPAGTAFVVDGNPDTSWSTDPYANATFGNLYPGIGLDLQLPSSIRLHKLKVTSQTPGWTAQTYVSANPITSGQAVTVWGPPTDTKTSTSTVTTFDLHGRTARYVLFWLTNLGPPRAVVPGVPNRYQANIAEISIS
jgi:serine/threonine-protein kinase